MGKEADRMTYKIIIYLSHISKILSYNKTQQGTLVHKLSSFQDFGHKLNWMRTGIKFNG